MSLSQMGNYNNGGFNGNNGFNNGGNNAPFNTSAPGPAVDDNLGKNKNIGRVYASDGIIDFAIWFTDKGPKLTITTRIKTGQDPTNGSILYEQKQPKELARFYMNLEEIRRMLDGFELCENEKYENVNFNITKAENNLMSFTGDGTNIKLFIATPKNGTRTINFEPVSIGPCNSHASFKMFVAYLKAAYKQIFKIRGLGDLDDESAED